MLGKASHPGPDTDMNARRSRCLDILHATQSIFADAPITASLAATPPIIDPGAIAVPDDISDDILQDTENDRISPGLF